MGVVIRICRERITKIMRSLRVTCLVICLPSFAACVSTHDDRLFSQRLSDTGAPALHAVHDARLRNLMREMNSLMFERMRTELELDQERRQKALQIGRVAAEMEETVADIIDSLPRLPLNEDEQISFLALAEKLRDQVRMVKDLADHNHIDAIPGTLRQMTTTCTMCHHLFRKPVERRND